MVLARDVDGFVESFELKFLEWVFRDVDSLGIKLYFQVTIFHLTWAPFSFNAA